MIFFGLEFSLTRSHLKIARSPFDRAQDERGATGRMGSNFRSC